MLRYLAGAEKGVDTANDKQIRKEGPDIVLLFH